MIIQKIDDWGGNVIPGEPVDGDLIRITYPNGTIQEKKYREFTTPEDPLRVYVHVGGDTGEIENSGADTLNIVFTLRETAEPSSDVITNINVDWSFMFRDHDNFVFDYIKVDFINGIANAAYTTQGKAGKIHLRSSDVNEVLGAAIITLVGEPSFKIYRDFR